MKADDYPGYGARIHLYGGPADPEGDHFDVFSFSNTDGLIFRWNDEEGVTVEVDEEEVTKLRNALDFWLVRRAHSTYTACPNHKGQSYNTSTGDCSCGSNHRRWASKYNPGGLTR